MMRDSVQVALRALVLGAVLAGVPLVASAEEPEQGMRADVGITVEITPRPAALSDSRTDVPTEPAREWGVAPVVIRPVAPEGEALEVPEGEVPSPPARAELEQTGFAVLPTLATAGVFVAAGGGVLLHRRRTAQQAPSRRGTGRAGPRD